MSRYVILAHDHPFPHFDLMLESGDVLRTWRLLALPAVGVSVPAVLLGDHRRDYLDYEGPVSNGRGVVKRVADGTFTMERDEPAYVIVKMSGGIIGRMTLREENGQWTAVLE
jgi:hypothetical protein